MVALAVGLQLAEPLLGSESADARAHMSELRRDVQQALDEAARLGQRIYPPQLDAMGLAAALRAAATSAGIRASVDVDLPATCPPEVVRTVYLCWLEAIAGAGPDAPTTIAVRGQGRGLAFEIATSAPGAGMRDRVEALEGTLTVEAGAAGGWIVSGALPLFQ